VQGRGVDPPLNETRKKASPTFLRNIRTKVLKSFTLALPAPLAGVSEDFIEKGIPQETPGTGRNFMGIAEGKPARMNSELIVD
jgi:hypothetical protein